MSRLRRRSRSRAATDITRDPVQQARRLPRGTSVTVSGAPGKLVGVTPHNTVWIAWRPDGYAPMVARFDARYPNARAQVRLTPAMVDHIHRAVQECDGDCGSGPDGRGEAALAAVSWRPRGWSFGPRWALRELARYVGSDSYDLSLGDGRSEMDEYLPLHLHDTTLARMRATIEAAADALLRA